MATWRAAVPHAGGRVIGLDAVPAQEATYQRSGFTTDYRTGRYAGRPVRPGVAPSADVVPVGPSHLGGDRGVRRGLLPRRPTGLPGALVDGRGPHRAGPPARRAGRRLRGDPAGPRGPSGRPAVRGHPGGSPGPFFDALTEHLGPDDEVFVDVPENNDAARALATSRGLEPRFPHPAHVQRPSSPDALGARLRRHESRTRLTSPARGRGPGVAPARPCAGPAVRTVPASGASGKRAPPHRCPAGSGAWGRRGRCARARNLRRSPRGSRQWPPIGAGWACAADRVPPDAANLLARRPRETSRADARSAVDSPDGRSARPPSDRLRTAAGPPRHSRGRQDLNPAIPVLTRSNTGRSASCYAHGGTYEDADQRAGERRRGRAARDGGGPPRADRRRGEPRRGPPRRPRRRQGRARLRRWLRSRAAARRVRRPGHAGRGLPRRDLHLPGAGPDRAGGGRRGQRQGRALHREELHRRRAELRHGRRAGRGRGRASREGPGAGRRRRHRQHLHRGAPRHRRDALRREDRRARSPRRARRWSRSRRWPVRWPTPRAPSASP